MILITYNFHKNDPQIRALGATLENELKYHPFFIFLKLTRNNDNENASLIKSKCKKIEKEGFLNFIFDLHSGTTSKNTRFEVEYIELDKDGKEFVQFINSKKKEIPDFVGFNITRDTQLNTRFADEYKEKIKQRYSKLGDFFKKLFIIEIYIPKNDGKKQIKKITKSLVKFFTTTESLLRP